MANEEDLKIFWENFQKDKNLSTFHQYLIHFNNHFKECLERDVCQIREKPTEGPDLFSLPDNFLQTIESLLKSCSSACCSVPNVESIQKALSALKSLIILCRNLENIPFLSSCNIVTHIVIIASSIIRQPSSADQENSSVEEIHHKFLKTSFCFLEILYDPFSLWKARFTNQSVGNSVFQFGCALLHLEVVPFFYDCFLSSPCSLSSDLQIHLLHVLGAILSGAQHNALVAITPATLDILYYLLSDLLIPSKAKEVVLQCFSEIVHILCICRTDQRQIEISTILDGFVNTIIKICNSNDADEHCTDAVNMIGTLQTILCHRDNVSVRKVFQDMNYCDILLQLLENKTLDKKNGQEVAAAVLSVITGFISKGSHSKKHFISKHGFKKLCLSLQNFGQPSPKLIDCLFNLAADNPLGNAPVLIKNGEIAVAIIDWLPTLESHELQSLCIDRLLNICKIDLHSRIICCQNDIVSTILKCFTQHQKLACKTIGLLLKLLEIYLSHSTTHKDLKEILLLLRPEIDGKQFAYVLPFMHILSSVAKKFTHQGPSYFFDFQDTHNGITISGLRKWPGMGFTFHTCLCLDKIEKESPRKYKRRQLYSFLNSYGSGFEAFFTEDSIMVVAASTKKEYHAAVVTDCCLDDGAWHCVTICHMPSRRPFTNSTLVVTIDNKQKLTAQLKFPSLNEPFTSCNIGSGIKTCVSRRRNSASDPANENKSYSFSSLGGATIGHLSNLLDKEKLLSLAPNLTLSQQLKNMLQSTPDPAVQSCPFGSQDTIWGSSDSLKGQMMSVCVFSEALLPAQVKALQLYDQNNSSFFTDDSSEMVDISNKLVLYYNAKASANGICTDLSSNQIYEGKVSGNVCAVSSIKDAINTCGGISALLPLLENASRPISQGHSVFADLIPQDSIEEVSEEWVVLPNSSYSDWHLCQNQVSGFLLSILHLIENSVVNQEQLLGKSGIPTIGTLMQRVPASLIDVNVLMAVQLLVEGTSSCEKAADLLRAIHQYILFDFRIWSKGAFAVRIGHIQYLSTIIKDNHKYYRKQYGVQFLLDTIQMFYSNCDLLCNEDIKTIRVSLLGLIKYYVTRDINIQDISALIGFLISVKEEEMLEEVLDVILSIMENRVVKDQLFLLMYEPGCSELLYCLIINPEFSENLKLKVLKVIAGLLKSDKVYEKSKSRLRLHDIGFGSLTSLLTTSNVTSNMINVLMDQILMTETLQAYQGAVLLLHFIRNMNIDIKLESIQKLKQSLNRSTSNWVTISKLTGWQECLLGLLIKYPVSDRKESFSNIPTNLIDFSSDISSDMSPEFKNVSKAENRSESPRTGSVRRLSRRASWSQHSIEESVSLPKTPQLLMQLREHIFDFDFPNLLNRSRSGSRNSSLEDLTVASSNDTKSLPDSSSSGYLTTLESNLKISQDSDENQTLIETENQDLVLCQTVITVVCDIVWKGIDGSSKQIWEEYGHVFACVNMLALSNELYSSHLEIKRYILEYTLQLCLNDIQETAQTNALHSENAIRIIRFVYDFVVLENTTDERRLSEKLLDKVLALLDILLVFEEGPEEGWAEMAELGLNIILICAKSDNLELCAMATAKLHALVQTRPNASLEETSYLLYNLDLILKLTVEDKSESDEISKAGKQEHYSFLIPVVRALLEKINVHFQIQKHLPSLSLSTAGPAFFEEFQQYALSSEWKSFIEKLVKPHQQKYTMLYIEDQKEIMNTFWNHCYEAIMVAMHKRNREVGESKLRFQSQIMENFRSTVAEEHNRYQDMQTNLRYQNIFIRRQWRMTKLNLCSPCGPWSHKDPRIHYWKLSHHENIYRMRLKLVLNYNFDDHHNASRLRDNQGAAKKFNMGSLPPIVREAVVSEQQEDSLADEDLQVISTSQIEGPDTAGKEKSIISEDCELVTLMSAIKGKFEVTTTNIYFFDLSPVKEEVDQTERHDFKCSLAHLREIHLRRYNLRRSALEFFLIDQTNFFLNFNASKRNKIYGRIVGLRPPNLIYSYGIRTPAELLKSSGWMQKWVQREISNFEYLMHLNTIAGRTYNDLSQYPVFPWILADYTSSELDLDNPAVYRDLSKPIGVVNPKNITEVKTKYENFIDITGTVEKFHYGTHYSNSAGVLHYLVRVEPFTSLHVDLQSGRFDVADRQFHSLEATWKMLMENPNDVKELIPEFFYLPEFLVNMNGA
ncbi:neurobeachin-like protein 1 isoform X3 [Centruroides vittatus]|uniref:neurobeachin-like protein 1 isoform X3 n=1 Tax=Centruroides vittatus TaxID=120091 RepID=UPI0035103252